ncbi:general secretion pathway protein GspK [Aliidiomarina halalkaliphila]|uniref:Type II secretion system protein K n=1 Tax=Aliidiomarina halalkaliphila TaxID=2593535 RepID=A0A552X5S4_9GAMM|nr:type II secretion system minor pseudopilin GspK [Aliidiomarina halalkaliphila]TRW50309.1 general secretion pathway protein GspK [Aliidiomarina halalkaliphila]
MMRKQQGSAIIMVMLIIALIAVMAVQMSERLRLQIARIAGTDFAEQAYWHWLSAEALARQVLTAELEAADFRAHLGQNWATEQGPFPVRGGVIGGRIRDLHSCFNLNSLFNGEGNEQRFSVAVDQYQSLLSALEFDEFTSERLTATLIDWLDKDSELHNSFGAEDPDYESMPQPYQAANTLLSHRSELRQIIGYTQEVYETLRPFVCVIPASTEFSMNLNTVKAEHPELVQAFFRGQLDRNAAEGLLSARPDEGFESVDAIRQQPEIQNLLSDDQTVSELELLTVESKYFELQAHVQYGDLEYYGFSQMLVAGGDVHILHRSRGGYVRDE